MTRIQPTYLSAQPLFATMSNCICQTVKQMEVAHVIRRVGCAVAVSVLVACGGGGEGAGNMQAEPSASVRNEQGAQGFAAAGIDSKTQALMQQGARLNTSELEAIAKTGVLPQPFNGRLLSGTETAEARSQGEAKSAASRVPVYRFYNSGTGAHFFTTSTAERDHVRDTLPAFSYEGIAFYTSSAAIPGLSPVHRFYNGRTGVHFYTISEAERANVVATLPQFGYEGIAYYASTLAGTGYTPLYRFFYGARGFHFYTNSVTEKDNIIATLLQYRYEGVGYYVLDSDWQTPAVPHTGITANQCYQAGNDALVSCASAGANALNNQQDGDRTAINPMSYSQVVSFASFSPVPIILYFPKTSCVRDYVTGLIWEGKEVSGPRAGSDRYTYYGDNRAGDVSAYVNSVNGMNLCGFNDWRVPLVEELQGIIDHGVASGPRIRMADFPNTPAAGFWASDDYLGDALSRWTVGFSGFGDGSGNMGATVAVRLVRGSPWSGSRYLTTSVHYLTDGSNNAVIDRKTGLTWRRCLEGQFWTGSACTGAAATTFNHANALIRGASIAGWRLPNIKELASLSDRSRQIPALDSNVFPGQGGGLDTWSSTPVSHRSQDAELVLFSNGFRGNFERTNARAVHLVRDTP